MQLSKAISGNIVSLAQAQNTYKQNVVAVNMVISSVLQSKLPALHQPPPDWNLFVDSYVKANTHALDWVNNVMARLLSVPDEVQSYNHIITTLLKDANSQATKLVSNPKDKNALEILHNDLDGITAQLSIVTTFISGSLSKIRNFKDNIPQMAKELQTIADKSTADAKADEKKIKELKKDIENLNADIANLADAIVALGIADVAAITLGSIATIAAFPEGLVAWLFCGPAVAVATTFIVLDAIKISQDKAEIDSKKSEMDQLTADVSTLHLLTQNYNKLATSTKALEENLKAILKEWLLLENSVNSAINDIKASIKDTEKADFEAVQKDINQAIAEWNEAYRQAGALHLDLKANDAPLKVGMSQDEVKNALAKGKSMDIIEYYNKVA